jgi:uncharacterized protein YbcC (UPF0753/DUF2309 family)
MKLQESSTLTMKTQANQQAVDQALERIPPLWPLEHFVAVNPFMGLTSLPFAEACSLLRRNMGQAPLQSLADYRRAWDQQLITSQDLGTVTNEPWSKEKLLDFLRRPNPATNAPSVLSFADLLDESFPNAHWTDFIAEEMSKWCAVHFDRNQTIWNSPWRKEGLFAAWLSAARHDRKPEVFGMPGFRDYVKALPQDPQRVIDFCLGVLAPQGVEIADFLHRQLVIVLGWAGHVRYLDREDEMRGQKAQRLRELLAIRLVYDAVLHRAFAQKIAAEPSWACAATSVVDASWDDGLARWQLAYERGYQRQLAQQMIAQPARAGGHRPAAQAVFCIDVRSEIYRRHLEAASANISTLGFAGFFGFPIAHQTADACHAASRCPALLVPPLQSHEPQDEQAPRSRAEKASWKAFQNSAVSCFTFVESLGMSFATSLFSSRDRSLVPQAAAAPSLPGMTDEQLAGVAEGALRGMSLTENFARLVLICGHGSHSANNPFASSLDCGACGGHAGDVNARLAAQTLNRRAVRDILATKGILIPDDVHFLAAQHDTLSDDVMLFDRDTIPVSHQEELAELEHALHKASESTRRERAKRLGLVEKDEPSFAEEIRQRGQDIAQIRPEWALANNAALIVAPRSRTASLRLDGRTFLHEYDPMLDPESQVLTVILTAPVVVASWINLQYFGSRTMPETFAAGDKTIHQVVAGVGVIEGNAGDLRSGLPWQSIHNGETFMHEPRRLTVFLESETEKVDAVLAAHPAVRQLFDNEWIHLIVMTGKQAHLRRQGQWQQMLLGA